MALSRHVPLPWRYPHLQEKNTAYQVTQLQPMSQLQARRRVRVHRILGTYEWDFTKAEVVATLAYMQRTSDHRVADVRATGVVQVTQNLLGRIQSTRDAVRARIAVLRQAATDTGAPRKRARPSLDAAAPGASSPAKRSKPAMPASPLASPEQLPSSPVGRPATPTEPNRLPSPDALLLGDFSSPDPSEASDDDDLLGSESASD
ncbi:hypothetical protein DIPPA_26872 [Diplonema papillatum]|nr:hypothetical protein DIPPA_26872 [Diplonema papillatum]|eukprot:gene10527-16185_t